MESHKKNLINSIKSNLSKYGSCSSDFDLNPDMAFNQNSNFLEASVLIPVLTFKKNLEILLTKRSINLKNHPGQIAFPGGKKENFDISPIETALRETEEEVGLSRHLVEIIASLPTHKTATGFIIKPYIGIISQTFEETLSCGEVDEIFTVPFDHILNGENFFHPNKKMERYAKKILCNPIWPFLCLGCNC